MSFTRRMLPNVILGFVSLAVALLLLEIGVRVFLGEQPKFPRRVVGAQFGLRVNQPGAVYRHTSADVSVSFRINSRGLRDDREFSYEKPDGVLRIVSIGDSFTVGYEVQQEETFSSVLESELRSRRYLVEVLNAGVSGYSTAEEVLYLERELLRYAPDLVLVSFCVNDLVDNTRTNLFRLENDVLVENETSYVPGGGLADFLNTNPLFNWLSERSDAFVLAKEQATLLLKRRMVQENVAHERERTDLAPMEAEAAAVASKQRRLGAALFERMYRMTRQRGIPLVIMSIPGLAPPTHGFEILELFPLAEFDVDRPGLYFLSGRQVLSVENRPASLIHTRSHGHWTPLSHRLVGQALARLIDEGGLLHRPLRANAPLQPPVAPGGPVLETSR